MVFTTSPEVRKLNSLKPPPLRPSNRYGECLDTRNQRKLYVKATRLLRKIGFVDAEFLTAVKGHYSQADLYGQFVADNQPVPAEYIGQNGLRMCALAGRA